MLEVNALGYSWTTAMEGGRVVNPYHPNVVFDDKNVEIKNNGVVDLTTTMLSVPVINTHWDGKQYISNYSAGVLRSIDAFTYGAFTIQAVLPKGSGQHAAFWLTGRDSWPPEIDCFETYNTIVGKTTSCLDPIRQLRCKQASSLVKWNCLMPTYRIQPNIHYGEQDNDKDLITFNIPRNFLSNPYDTYNEYKIVWEPNKILIYYDGNLILNCYDKNILEWFNISPWMHVILNNYYIRSIQDGNEDEMLMRKTPFRIKEFIYTPMK